MHEGRISPLAPQHTWKENVLRKLAVFLGKHWYATTVEGTWSNILLNKVQSILMAFPFPKGSWGRIAHDIHLITYLAQTLRLLSSIMLSHSWATVQRPTQLQEQCECLQTQKSPSSARFYCLHGLDQTNQLQPSCELLIPGPSIMLCMLSLFLRQDLCVILACLYLLSGHVGFELALLLLLLPPRCTLPCLDPISSLPTGSGIQVERRNEHSKDTIPVILKEWTEQQPAGIKPWSLSGAREIV